MATEFFLYPLCKLIEKKEEELNLGIWVLFALSLLFYIFYPKNKPYKTVKA